VFLKYSFFDPFHGFVAFLNQNFILISKTTRPRDCFASLMIPLFVKNSRLGYFFNAKSPQGGSYSTVSLMSAFIKCKIKSNLVPFSLCSKFYFKHLNIANYRHSKVVRHLKVLDIFYKQKFYDALF
jgi:hypothetical protein